MSGSYPDGLNQSGFDQYWSELLDEEESELIDFDAEVRLIQLPKTLNVGCSQCGETAVQALVHVQDAIQEIIETQCQEHAGDTNG